MGVVGPNGNGGATWVYWGHMGVVGPHECGAALGDVYGCGGATWVCSSSGWFVWVWWAHIKHSKLWSRRSLLPIKCVTGSTDLSQGARGLT